MTQIIRDNEGRVVQIPTTDEEVLESQLPEKTTVEADRDDMSALFEPPKMTDDDMDASDLVTIDIENDVMDGDLSDLVDVSEEDIMGEDVMGLDDDLSDLFDLPGGLPKSQPAERYRIAPRGRQAIRRPQPPSSMGRVGY